MWHNNSRPVDTMTLKSSSEKAPLLPLRWQDIPPDRNGCASSQAIGGPMLDNSETWIRYGAHGGHGNNLSQTHAGVFGFAFSATHTFMRYLLFPLTIVAAFVLGVFVAGISVFAQAMGLHVWARLCGEAIGIFVLEITGKRAYYQKKGAYYELAALDLKDRNPKINLGLQII
eukprot:m.331808 g.331808  ORF g.331808 m.331808 type:complete len:172 (-) comp16797_c0_seq1:1170-1685(-)